MVESKEHCRSRHRSPHQEGYAVLGECKWWEEPVGVDVLDDLIEARSAIGPKANQAKLALFS